MAWADDTSEQLLVDVRSTGFLPDASDQTDAVLLRFADSEQRTMIAAAVKANRGERWLRYEDQTIVAGTTRYRLPRRSLAGTSRAVTVIDSTGMPLPPLTELSPIVLRGMFKTGDASDPRFFAFEDDFVNLGAVPASSGYTLRIHYVLRPGALVLVGSNTACCRVAYASSTTVLVLYDVAPSTDITTSSSQVDIIRGVDPYPVSEIDRVVSAYANPNLTLNSASPIVVADFTVGLFSTYSAKPGQEAMWVVRRDTTPFPMIPKVLWDALVHGTVAQALEAVRDPQSSGMRGTALAKLNEALVLMGPRDQRNSKRIVSASALRTGRRGSRLQRPS